MSDDEKAKKFRSPPYPAIGLQKAIDRARELYAKAQGFQVGFKVLADAWGYREKSSGLWGTAAALIHYGLLEDEGTGKSRKFKISEAANRILRDLAPDSEKRREAIRRAALKPAIFSELWEKFGSPNVLSDAFLVNYLALDRGDEGKAHFSDSSAADVIKNYRETVSYAGLGDLGGVSSEDGESDHSDKPKDADKKAKAKVGDFVQWIIDGSDQFKVSRKVDWVSEDGRLLRVQGSPTGIDMDQITVTNPPAPPALTSGTPVHSAQSGKSEQDINVYLTGKRLQITADVDAVGLQRLKQVLEKYDDILKLLQ